MEGRNGLSERLDILSEQNVVWAFLLLKTGYVGGEKLQLALRALQRGIFEQLLRDVQQVGINQERMKGLNGVVGHRIKQK